MGGRRPPVALEFEPRRPSPAPQTTRRPTLDRATRKQAPPAANHSSLPFAHVAAPGAHPSVVAAVAALAAIEARGPPLITKLARLIQARRAKQAAVKREDEQEFARRNGANLMFCEDAARRVKALLESDERVVDWRLVATHRESLHPHDAVATAVKGVLGGLQP